MSTHIQQLPESAQTSLAVFVPQLQCPTRHPTRSSVYIICCLLLLFLLLFLCSFVEPHKSENQPDMNNPQITTSDLKGSKLHNTI